MGWRRSCASTGDGVRERGVEDTSMKWASKRWSALELSRVSYGAGSFVDWLESIVEKLITYGPLFSFYNEANWS